MSFNKVILQGRLTDDPKLRKTADGTSVANFSLAVDRSFGDEKQTDFIPVVVWKGLADTIDKYCSKGTLLLVCGSLHTKSWEDKDGNKRTGFEVMATEFSFCDTKSNSMTNSSTDNKKGSQAKSEPQLEPINDDLPF